MSNGSALLVTHEPLEPRMAGPAIRAWHLAQELAGARPVILATPAIRGLQSPHPAVTLVAYDPSNGAPLTELTRQSAVIITSGYLLRRYPALVRAGLPLAIDLYDPFVLENL
ncbi:MAG: glycosyl transferase family 1, partial [Ardenticatenales bacterium]|nr:glycosyl transferase family 1 [Ardenticatenales bacterium]